MTTTPAMQNDLPKTSDPAVGSTDGLGWRPMFDLDDEVRWILGRPCFAIAGIAGALRKNGYKCERKAEDEQAVAIHWMLSVYFAHGKGWREAAQKELDAMTASQPNEQLVNSEHMHG
jgi:hypothetical protein